MRSHSRDEKVRNPWGNLGVRDAEAVFVEKQVHHPVPRVSGNFDLCVENQ